MAEQSEQPVNTFTITFREAAYDESAHARSLSRRFNTRHTELPLLPHRFLSDLPALLSSTDQPSGDGPNTYVVSKLTKEAGITVALSGLGGDELFAGYSTFRRYARLRQLRTLWLLPKRARQLALQGLAPGTNRQKMTDLANLPSLQPAGLFPLLRQSLSATAVGALLGRPAGVTSYEAWFAANRSSLVALPLMSQVSVSELVTYTMPLLLRDADQMSMASALELRVPLLDYELVEFMLQVPDKYKLTPAPKQLLVEALGPLLPADLLTRPKQGFGFPWAHWLRHELAPFCAQQIEHLAQRDLFNSHALRHLYRRFQAGDPSVGWNQVWLLVALENWLTEHTF